MIRNFVGARHWRCRYSGRCWPFRPLGIRFPYERGGGRDEPVRHHRRHQRTVASRDLSCNKIPFPIALNEPYPVYGLFREIPVRPRKAVPKRLLAFAVEDGLKVHSAPLRNFADSCCPS